ncbi:MAG: MFS transporter [Phycisphaerales bacterium]
MRQRLIAILLPLLLLLSAMPDTMAAPVLKELFVDRYGVGPRAAQLFMAVNLVGALAAVPLLVWARRRASAVTLLVVGSVADAVLLGVLAMPVGFASSLVLRAAEGVTDVVVFAALFDLVRRRSGAHAARGLGYASTPLLLGLGVGAVVGGQAAQRVIPDRAGGLDGITNAGADVAMAVFGVSALACILVALGAFVARRQLLQVAQVEPEASPLAPSGESHAAAVAHGVFDDRPRPLWWACAMAFADRATGGLITGTLPLALAEFLGYSKQQRGWLIGLPLLLMALGTGPSGALCDRVGSLRVRLIAGVFYALAFAAIPFAAGTQWMLAAAMFAVGISGAALFSSSLAVAAESGGAAVAIGGLRAAGDLGFFAGTALSVLALQSLGREPRYEDYTAIISGFGALHLLTTGLLAALALTAARRAGRTAP